MIIEIKVAKSKKDLDMKESVERAMRQSMERRYVERFAHFGFGKTIVMGMAFYGKEVAMDFKERDLWP